MWISGYPVTRVVDFCQGAIACPLSALDRAESRHRLTPPFVLSHKMQTSASGDDGADVLIASSELDATLHTLGTTGAKLAVYR